MKELNFKLPSSLIHDLQQNPKRFYREGEVDKIKFGTYQLDKAGNRKKRNVAKPFLSLKAHQTRIKAVLDTILLPTCMKGGIKGQSSVINAFEHASSKFFLCIDLKNYFNNITNGQVNRMLLAHGFSQQDARMMTKLTTVHGSLPQGAPSSTTIANLVFAPTADQLSKVCEASGIIFTNFVDDLTFSSLTDFKEFIPAILDILTTNGFKVNHKKVCYRHSSCEVTGLIIKKGQLHFESEMAKRVTIPALAGYVRYVTMQNTRLKQLQ